MLQCSHKLSHLLAYDKEQIVSLVKHSPYKLVHIPTLLRNLPGDLVGANRVIIWLFTEAKVVAQVDQGHGDTKPHTQQGQHCGERNLRKDTEKKRKKKKITNV